MPPRRRGGTRTSKRVARPVAGGASLDVLPDEVLHHVLSFLPAQEAVRTCVLGQRWRHLWKSATGFRILCGDEEEAESIKELQGFVEHLLLLRAGAPLNTCQICLLDIEEDEDNMRRIRLWIRHVMLCKVRVLSVSTRFSNGGPWSEEFYLDELPLISQHLKRLELRGQNLNDSSVDFSGCPALEVLEIKQCGMLDLRKMVSQSLKFLSITGRCEFTDGDRFHVYAPNLVSLRLEVWYGMAPIFSPMPSLVEAAVKIDYGGCDFFYDDTDCVLLQGLSEAQSLVLISDTIPGSKSMVQMEGISDPAKRSNAIPQHLKVVELKCEVVDNRVLNVLEFLNKHGICPKCPGAVK